MSIISVNEIVPGLWLGNEEASQSDEFLKKANIGVIVNATKHIPCKWKKAHFVNVDYYRVPVNDPGPTSDLDQEDNKIMLSHLPHVVKYININLKSNKNVLVHCHAGIQRSAAIVLAYLMAHYYVTGHKKDRLQKSLRHIMQNRPVVFYEGTVMSFRPAVTQYIIDI
jgi:protein-tyrosine phosphatase